jgi:Family of unknown function (DUF6152)
LRQLTNSTLRRLVRQLPLLSLLVLAGVALAHHSFASYDMRRDVRIAGTVVQYQWMNPHSWVKVQTLEADGAEHVWNIEFGTPSISIRTGWTPTTFKAGDKATFIFHPRIDGELSGILAVVIMEDGKTLHGSTPLATPADSGSSPTQP